MSENLNASKPVDAGVLEIFGTPSDARLFDELVELYKLPGRENLICTAFEMMEGLLAFLPDGFVPIARKYGTDDHAVFLDRVFLPFMPQYKKEIGEDERSVEEAPQVLISRMSVTSDDIIAISEIVQGYKNQEFTDILYAMVGFMKFTAMQGLAYVPAMINYEKEAFVILDFPELRREPEEKPVLPTQDAMNATKTVLAAFTLRHGPQG